MTWWQALILGIVEGLTEFLPVSSTGHLLVVQALLGIGTESEEAKRAADAYAICIQAGAILAVLGLYRARAFACLRGVAGAVRLGSADPVGLRLTTNLVVAFLPAAVVGLLLNDRIETYLFGPWPIVAAWFVGGLAILGVVFFKERTASRKDDVIAEGASVGGALPGKALESLSWRMALAIGLIQCLAMWPGTSRSLVTIVGGVLIGLSLASAVEFSFLLGVVTLCAATAYKINDAGPQMLEAYGWAPLLIGSVAAWGSAVVAVRWMVAYLKKHGMSLFGYYRIGLAILVAALLLTGVISG